MNYIEVGKYGDLYKSLQAWEKAYRYIHGEAATKTIDIRMDEIFRAIYSFEKVVRLIDIHISESGKKHKKFLARWNSLSNIGLDVRERQLLEMDISTYRRMLYSKYMGFIDEFYEYVGTDTVQIKPCEKIYYELED